MPEPAIDYNLLRVFRVLMEERSVTQAAGRLGLTQSSMSNALNRLRAALGDRVLEREGNIMVPTMTARALWDRIAAPLAQLESEVDLRGAFRPHEYRGTFRIAVEDYALEVAGARMAQVLQAAAPGASLALLPFTRSSDAEMLASGEADLAVAANWDLPPAFRVQKLFSETFTALVAAGHPLVGAAWLLMKLGPGTADQLECQIGPIPFREEDGAAWITAPSGQKVHALEEAGDSWLVEMPLKYQLTRLDSAKAVSDLTPEFPSGVADFYFWAWERPGPDGVVRARFFSPDGGITEDAATGSAAVALAAVMRHEGEESGRLVIHQGEEMGAPSLIQLRWDEAGTHVGGAVARTEVCDSDTCQRATPRSAASRAAAPWSTSEGAPDSSSRATSISANRQAPRPAPIAFRTASLAANRTASRSAVSPGAAMP